AALDRLVESRQRLCVKTLILQHGAEIVERLRQVGTQRNDLAVGSGGAREVALLVQHSADVEVRLRIGRLPGGRVAVSGERLVELALPLPNDADIVARL